MGGQSWVVHGSSRVPGRHTHGGREMTMVLKGRWVRD